ncbi:unnamed protein product, partial [Allacma fusca]
MDANDLRFEPRDLKVFLKANGVIPEKGEEKKNTGF